MRHVLAGVLILFIATLAAADDRADRERRAKAAFAITDPSVAAKIGDCPCPAGTRAPWSEQLTRAFREEKVLVLFGAGTEPRCCNGTLIGTFKDVPPGVSADKPIVVYAPVGKGTLQIVAELPADATNVQLRSAVKRAHAAMSAKPK